MKKAISLLILVLFLFSCVSCVPGGHEEPETAPAALSGTGDGPAFFQLQELPDIGSYVPHEKPAYFFDDGPRDVFEPRDDYGGVLPYCAGMTDFYEPAYFFNEETGETDWDNKIGIDRGFGSSHALFGVMTADGRIITGGVYTFCRYFDAGGSDAFWLFERAQGNVSHSFVISADGKTLAEADQIRVEPCGDGYVLVCGEAFRSAYGYSDYRLHHVSSPDGETLLGADALGAAVPEGLENAELIYAGNDGYLLRVIVTQTDWDEETDEMIAGTDAYCYLDPAGNLKSRFEADDSEWLSVLCGRYLVSDGYGVLDFSGAPVGIDGYDEYQEDALSGCFFALKYDDPEEKYDDQTAVEVDVYDAGGNRTAHYRTTNAEKDYFRNYLLTCNVGFRKDRGELFSLLTGQALDPGVGRIDAAYRISSGTVYYDESAFSLQTLQWVALQTESGEWYACRLSDLKTVKIREPAVSSYGDAVLAFCQGDVLVVCSDAGEFLYDLADGNEKHLPQMPADGNADGEEPNMVSVSKEALFFYRYADGIYGSRTYMYTEEKGDWNVLVTEYPSTDDGDLIFLCTKNHAYTLRSDGTVLASLEINAYV
ncbi:MAG: hypothetical protein IJK02_02425 [Clostridia bacterium]|nr:hypothetical protein [Clostridia bacterium]